jgi:Xaa-Pro dipeptidase
MLDVAAVRSALAAETVDGWLLYDFHGINPIAVDLAGTAGHGHLATRRWYYLIRATGEPRKLVHAIEADALAHLPGTTVRYAGRDQLERGLTGLLEGMRRVAMEYSPLCAIPYVARVDAGTIELVRQRGVEVVSSGDLVQRFSAVWGKEEIAMHQRASEALYRIKDRALELVAARVGGRIRTTEYDVQQRMAAWFAEEGLVTDSPPIVAVNENAGNPHYLPASDQARAIEAGQLVLLDLWGRLSGADSVFADITWMAYTGTHVPDRFAQAFAAIRDARDSAVALVETRARAGGDIRGWEVDRAASGVLKERGYAGQILHRTGHSLGREVHGNGVNMDDYETHDDRRLLPGTGFTIEPGVYFPDFGVRSEINMIVYERDAAVTGPRQQEITALD